ncbi:MAG: magnesium transporter [Candidatus Bathyarchaeia archaeon]|jgi:mgtE-like transporter
MVYQTNPSLSFTSFKETLAGHFAGVGGLIAGLIVAWQLGVFHTVPWAIALYPTVLTAKSVISGTFSGRLNTALHIGTLSPRFSGNMGFVGRTFQRALALTMVTSVVMSIVSTILGSLFWGITPANFSDVLTVVVATMSLGLTLYFFTLSVTFTAFKKGLDLDSVAYPIVATIADVFITVCYAIAVNLYFKFGYTGKYAVLLIAIVPAVLVLYSFSRGVHEIGFSKTIKTSILALMLVAVIASVTGTILQEINVGAALWIGGRALYPASLFAAYPALIELVGDVALVIGSTATTRLVLGLLEPRFSAMKNHAMQILGAWAASAVASIPLSAASLFLTGAFGLPAFYVLTSALLATNAFALVAMTLVSYALAILTFKKGLDPDHLVIPIESALAGTITSTALLAALFLLTHS